MLTLFLMTVFKLVFKWSSLLLFHVHRSTCVPEIMNCSNRDFNLGLEAWSFMTPWSSSNSLLLPTGPHLPHPVVQALLLLLLWQLHCLSLFFFPECYFAGKKLNHFSQRSDEHATSASEDENSRTSPFDINKFFHLLGYLRGSTMRWNVGNGWKLLLTAVLPPPATGSSFLPQHHFLCAGPGVPPQSRNSFGLTSEFCGFFFFFKEILLE